MNKKGFLLFFKCGLLVSVLLLALWGCEEEEEDNLPAEDILFAPIDTVLQVYLETNKIDSSTLTMVDSSIQHILLVGDSMAGAAGLEYGLRKFAQYNGHHLTIVSQASSTTALWSNQAKLHAAIARYKPTFVIIALGSNELFVKDIPQRKKYIKDIVEQAGDVPVIWVGPPNWREDTGINQAIHSVVGKDQFFLSKHVKISRQPDNIHPDIRGSITWTSSLSAWIMNACKYKIILENPAKVATRFAPKKKNSQETTALFP